MPGCPQPENPYFEAPQQLFVSPDARAVLQVMFANSHRVVVRQAQNGGFSGSRVLLVRPIQTPHEAELLAVVKIASQRSILQESRLAIRPMTGGGTR